MLFSQAFMKAQLGVATEQLKNLVNPTVWDSAVEKLLTPASALREDLAAALSSARGLVRTRIPCPERPAVGIVEGCETFVAKSLNHPLLRWGD
jgi:hypothetical protein